MLGVQQLASAFSLQNLVFFKKASLGDIVVDSGRCMFPVPDVCVCVCTAGPMRQPQDKHNGSE